MKTKYSMVRIRASRRFFIPSILATALALALSTKPVQAVGGNWTTTAGGSWATATSWSTNPTVPGSAAGDAIAFNTNIGAAATITLDGARTMGDLNIGDSTTGFFGYTINTGTSGTLVMDVASGSASIDFLNTGTNGAANTIGAGITLNDATVIRSNNDKVQTIGGIINDGAASLALTFNNDLNGTAAAAATNQGQFALSAANTYDGGTNISDVRVSATNATSFGTGAVSLSGAGQVYFSSAITVANNFNLNSTGWVEGGGNLGALRIDGATLSGTVTLQRHSEIGVNAGTGTISGAVNGAFNLTKTRGALLVLSGANNYTGITTVRDGQLRLNSANALGNSPSVIVQNPDNPGSSDTNTLQLTGGRSYGAGKVLYLLNNSTSNIGNARTALENVSGSNNTWAGDIVLEGGTNQTLTSSGNTLTIAGNISQAANPSTSMFIRGGGTGVINGSFNLGSGNLFKTDAGTWTINSGGNVQGNVTLGNGRLILNNNNAVLPTANLTLGEGNTNVTRVTINAGFSQGFNSIINAPTTTAAAGHSIDGDGTLALGTSGVTVTVTDTVAAANDLTISTAISGSGTLTKAGAGNLVLNSVSTAPISVNAGTLSGNITTPALTVASGTTLAPGTTTTAGTINTTTLSLDSGTIEVNLGSGGSDVINVSSSGGFTQSGTTAINVTPNGGFESTSTFYPVITYTGASPGTSGFTVGTLPGRLAGSVTDSGSAIGITATNDQIIWTGAAANGNWDVNTTTNWKKSSDGLETNFLALDDVIFNDDGIAQNSIALTGTINPVRVGFAHTAGTYILASGTLSGSGAMPLTVSGAGGTTILRNANTYTGPTTITAGTLELDHDGGTLTASSVVNVGASGTLRLTDDDGDFTFSRVLSGNGAVVINPNTDGAIATAAVRAVTLNGTSPLYTGEITLASPAKTGSSSRMSAAPTALGGATLVVQNENQFYASSNQAYANNITITGNGYNDALGSIGAMRMDGGVTWNGNIAVTGTAGDSAGTAYDARIGSNGGTNTITGAISGGDVNFWVYGTTQAFIRLAGANSYGDTIIGGTDNTSAGGINSITVGNGEAVPTNTVATLGTGDIYLVAGNNASPRQAILRLNRADGFTLGTGQDIIGSATASAQLVGGVQLLVDTTGTGFTVGANTIDIADGTSGGQIRVAQLASNSSMNIGTGSVVDTGFLRVGENSNLAGTINQTGGSVNALIDIRVGHYGGATSTYNFSSGTITLPTTPASEPSAAGEVSGALYVGVDGTGIFNQTGGTLNAAGIVLDNRGATAGDDQFNLSGGAVELRNTYGIVGRNTTATVALNGGTIKNVGTGVDVSINATNISTSGTTTLDTNGATNKFSLMSSITGAGTLTTTGGGLIELEPDSNATKTSVSTGTGTQTISAILAGSSAVTKVGSGTTTLSAANTYSGATTVDAGTLNITGSLANSDVTVATGASLGGEGSAKTLSFGSGTTNLFIDGSTAGALSSTGTLTISGTVSVDFTAPPPSTGAVTVLNHGGTSATFSNFTLANSSNYRSVTFTVSATDVTLDVNKKALVWDGDTATWEIGGTDNDWNDTANDNFFTGDAVTFDETYITTPQTVTMTGALLPSEVVVNNSTHKYTITGSGIGGATGITKSGSAGLDLGGTNTFTGPIAINGGVLTATTAAALGSTSAITVASGARVDLNGQTLGNNTNTTWTIAGDGGDGAGALGAITNTSATAIYEDSSVLNLNLSGNAEIGGNAGRFDVGRNGATGAANGVINGAGYVLTKVGANQVAMRGIASNITYVVDAGTLWFEDNDAASGSNPITVNGTALLGTYGARTIANDVTLNAGTSLVNMGGATSNWSGVITLGGNAAINNQNAGQINITGTISGNYQLSSLGGNTNVLISDNSTFTGKVLVDTGILRVSQDLALGAVPSSPLADAITLRNGGRIQAGGVGTGNDLTIDSNRGISLSSGNGGFHVWTGFTMSYAGAITGAGNLTKTDGGILTFGGTASNTGLTSINSGVTNLNGATINGTSMVEVATATLNINTGTTVTTPRFVTSQGSGTITTVNQTAGTLNITGTDSSNTNTASFLFGHWGTGASSTYNMSGGTLNSVGAEFSFGFDGTAFFNQTGGTVNVLGLDFGNARNNLGIYTLNGGRLNPGANGITTNANKVLNIGGGTVGAFADWSSGQAIQLTGVNGNATINNTDSVDNTTARTITLSGLISGPGGLIKTGAGRLALSATNTYTGNTFVNEGILDLTGGGGVNGTIRGTVTVNSSAILRLNTGDATGYDATTRLGTINLVGSEMNIAVTSNQTLGSAKINLTGATITGVAGSNLDFFAGSSALNSLASATTSTISGTQLKIRQTGGVTITTAAGTTASGVDLDISSVIALDAGFAGQPLVKAGAGTLKLSAANTYNSNTAVNAGRLLLTGSLAGTASVGTTGVLAGNGTVTGATTVATTGVLSPGNNDVNTLNFGSTLTLDTGSSYEVTITGATTNDKVIATGAMTANGNIVVTLSGYTPVAGDSFDIADASSITGTPTFALPTLSGLVWDTSSFTTDGKIKLVNLYTAWATATGATGGTTGDPDTDGLVNLLEYAFGTDPTVNFTGPLSYTGGTLTTPGQPILEKVGGVWYAVFTRRKDYVEAGLTYTVEFSNGLSAWTPGSAGLTVIASDSLLDVVRVPFPNFVPSDSGPQKPRFFRVEVSSSF